MTTTADFTMQRGDTLVLTATITADGVALDLTGATLRFTVKSSESLTDAQALCTLTTGAGIVHTNAAGGIATITLPATTTATLDSSPFVFVYDLQVTTSTSQVFTVARGALTVSPDVSRTTP